MPYAIAARPLAKLAGEARADASSLPVICDHQRDFSDSGPIGVTYIRAAADQRFAIERQKPLTVDVVALGQASQIGVRHEGRRQVRPLARWHCSS
jgi:hypothetical protein